MLLVNVLWPSAMMYYQIDHGQWKKCLTKNIPHTHAPIPHPWNFLNKNNKKEHTAHTHTHARAQPLTGSSVKPPSLTDEYKCVYMARLSHPTNSTLWRVTHICSLQYHRKYKGNSRRDSRQGYSYQHSHLLWTRSVLDTLRLHCDKEGQSNIHPKVSNYKLVKSIFFLSALRKKSD